MQEEEVVVVGSLYVYSCKYSGISRAMVPLCATSRGQPSSSVTSLQDSWCYFPIANKPCGSAERNKIVFPLNTSCQLLNFASISSFWVLSAQPYRAHPMCCRELLWDEGSTSQRRWITLQPQKLPRCSYNTLPSAPMSSTSPMTGSPTCQLN